MQESEYKKKQRSVRLIYADTIFSSLKDGLTSSFIVPFALALNAGSEYIAIISSAPHLMGSFFQLFASDMLNIFKNRKTVIVAAAFIDAILWLPILLIPYIWEGNYVLLLNFLILQAIATSVLNPFFSSLLGDLMPSEERGQISGRINQIAGIMSFISSLAGGLLLAHFKLSHPILGFTIIFFIAFLVRLLSSVIKSRFYEPFIEASSKGESLLKFGKSLRKTNFGKFVIYASLMKFAVGIASPFFTVYMLKTLKMDFITYSLINSASIISSFMVFRKWGSDIDKNGSKWMLGITGFLVFLIPFFWIIFKSPVLLFIVELFSGAVWAGYNLSTSNFVMDATNTKNRLLMTSYYNFFVGAMTFIGAIIGAVIIKRLPATFFGNIFLFVFAISAALRLLCSLLFLPALKDERFLDVTINAPRSKRIITIAPKEGAIFEYIPRKRE